MCRFAWWSVLILAGWSMCGVGCVPRVTMRLPAASAPYKQRWKAYQRYRPATKPLYDADEGLRGRKQTVAVGTKGYLYLEGGETVFRFEDLRQGVMPQSQTDRALQALRRARLLRETAYWGGMSLTVVGLSLGLSSFFSPSEGNDENAFLKTGVLVGAGACVVGLFLWQFAPRRLERSMKVARRNAAFHYQRDLARRLGVTTSLPTLSPPAKQKQIMPREVEKEL